MTITQMTKNKDRLQYIFAMMLFGTIGTLSRFIDMPTSIICLVRAAVGVIAILLILFIGKKKIDFSGVKKNIWWLILGAALLSLDWIFQFEAFKYTTIATSTLCYYMEPIFFIIAGSIVLKEKVSLKKWLCVVTAFIGMIFVSGVIQTGFHLSELKGALFGIIGGFFYAMVVLINKYIDGISPIVTTLVQMAVVSVLMLPYTLATTSMSDIHFTTAGVVCLLILGAVHTGINYVIYFDAVNKLPTQTVGILSYIDPVEAVLLSALFLKEPLTIWTIVGAILILGATAISEFSKSVVK